MMFMHKNMKYIPHTLSDTGNYPSYRKSKSPERMTGPDF